MNRTPWSEMAPRERFYRVFADPVDGGDAEFYKAFHRTVVDHFSFNVPSGHLIEGHSIAVQAIVVCELISKAVLECDL